MTLLMFLSFSHITFDMQFKIKNNVKKSYILIFVKAGKKQYNRMDEFKPRRI